MNAPDSPPPAGNGPHSPPAGSGPHEAALSPPAGNGRRGGGHPLGAASGPSGWQRDDPAGEEQPPLARDTEAEVVVVGAGLAGLALAHHLARHLPPAGILVLEAGRAGGGASGRSTGIAGPGVGGPITAQVRRYGPEVARRMFAASLRGIAALRELAGALPGDCELAETYQLITASTPAHATRLHRRAETLRDVLGFDVGYLDRADTAQRLGTDRYHGALCYPDVAMVNPWLLCQQLKRALLASGVRIAERTPVTAVTGGDPAVLRAGRHTVRARRVALATDGFTPALRLYRDNVATVRTHVLRTEVLPPDLLAETGWDTRGTFIDSRNFFNYVRLTARGRLLFGGGPALLDDRASARDVAAVRSRLERELATVFPALAGVEVTDFWSGITASTFDRLPIVGPVPGERGVWFAGAWCGHGLALSALTAERLAPILAAPILAAPILAAPILAAPHRRAPAAAKPATSFGVSAEEPHPAGPRRPAGPTANSPHLPVTGSEPSAPGLPAAGAGLPTAGAGLPTAGAGLPAAGPALPWQRGRAGWMPSGRLGGALLAAYLRGLEVADRAALLRARFPSRARDGARLSSRARDGRS